VHDLFFIVLTVIFFVFSVAYVYTCGRLREENAVNLETGVVLVICCLLTVYLVWALLRPEDF